MRGDPCCHEWGREGEGGLGQKVEMEVFEGSSSPPTIKKLIIEERVDPLVICVNLDIGLPWSGKCD